MPAKQKFTSEELRQFYFSKATNYAGFQKKTASHNVSTSSVDEKPETHRGIPTPLPTPMEPAATPSPKTESEQLPKTQVAGSAFAAVKESKSPASSGESVSPEYIAFLKKQQDLVKAHHAIDQDLAQLLELSSQHRGANSSSTQNVVEILREAEASTSWNWKSKFSREALVKDAALQVPATELCAEEDIPNVVDLQHQHQQLVKLRQDHCLGDNNASFRLTLENGIRRLDRLIKEYGHSQLDSTPVCRLSDNLLVQLDQMLSLEPLSLVVQDSNDRIVVLARKQKECMDLRDHAFEEGEMNVAERESFRLVDLSEELTNAQVEKIRLLEKALDENIVASEMRQIYSEKASEDTQAVEAKTTDLRSRCETDLARLYKLRTEVDETERDLNEKWDADRRSSDELLSSIGVRQAECWEGIQNLVKQLRQLEHERHLECKRRVEEKVRNETRRIEYRRFCEVSDAQAATLDRTIRNCDTNVHCAKLMAEFLQSGFFAIQKELSEKRKEVDDALLGAHKGHLEIFRSLLFTLSDLEHKRERRVQEVAESIQAAHIQQELCSDSLNPNAKKFSDAKKELLRVHDELELELRDIRDRISAANERFKPSEAALVAKSIAFTSPLSEMEERRLALRVKMVNYKAMSLGNVSTQPLREELDELKKSLEESRKLISNSRSVSRSRAGN